MTEEQQKFYDIKHTSDYKVIGLDIDYKIIVDNKNKMVILQYEESDSNLDWINNFLFIPCPLKLDNKIVWTTLGYARAYKSTENKPLDEFISTAFLHPDYKFCIRGWSFGSAMAKIAARHFNIRVSRELDELTTFGDVKCFLNPFKKPYCKRVREYWTPNDLVAHHCVPFYHSDKGCRYKVGPKLNVFSELFKTEYYHTHYEEYDYERSGK